MGLLFFNSVKHLVVFYDILVNSEIWVDNNLSK